MDVAVFQISCHSLELVWSLDETLSRVVNGQNLIETSSVSTTNTVSSSKGKQKEKYPKSSALLQLTGSIS